MSKVYIGVNVNELKSEELARMVGSVHDQYDEIVKYAELYFCLQGKTDRRKRC